MNKALLYTLRWLINDGISKGDNKKEALTIISALLGESTAVSVPWANKVSSPKPISPSTSSAPGGRVALVIGHNSKAKGAYVKGSINQFEYDFNGEVAAIIQSRAYPGLETKIFRRVYTPSGYSSEINTVYNQVNAWNPDFILELHFNSYPGGDYSFMLYHGSSSKSKAIAQEVNDVFCKHTGFKSNQKNAARSSGRGSLSLSKSKAPCVLTEPFFENNSSHLHKVESLGHTGMANIYLEAIKSVFRKNLA